MSQKSSVTTRSKLRRLAQEMSRQHAEELVSDSGLPSEKAPGSPSIAPTMASTSAPNIPLTGGRVIDHSERVPEGPQVGQTVATRRHTSRSSKASSKNSRRSTDYMRKKIEYEAELELVRLKENLLKKKMEADLAELEAAEDSGSSSEEDTARRVEDWVNTTPQERVVESETVLRTPPVSRTTREMQVSGVHINRDTTAVSREVTAHSVSQIMSAAASIPLPRIVTAPAPIYTPSTSGIRFRIPDDYPVLTTPAASVPRMTHYESDTQRQRYDGVSQSRQRRESSGDRRDRGIDQLAEAITNLARPRPIPRQAYELPSFNGDPAEWLSYRNMYRDTTELYKFKIHENLARLKTSLHGDARIAVEDLLRTSTDPDEIMRALEDEYGHPTLVLQCALNKVKNLPRVTESGKELRKFSTTVRNCVSLLKNVRAEGYLNNPQLVSELLGKLTPIQRSQYGDFAMGLDNSQGVDLRVSPNLEILSHFLVHLTRATSYYVTMGEPSATTAPARNSKTAPTYSRPMNTARTAYRHPQNTMPAAQRAYTQSDESPEDNSCAICQQRHHIEKCDEFKKLSVDKRWEAIKSKKLCFKCLVKTHPKRFCRAKRCEECGYGHHVLLHAKKNESAESVTNIGEWRATSFLKIVPVTVSDDSGVDEETYALLDDGATVSLIDSSLAANMKGPRVPLSLKTAGGHGVTDLTSRIVKVTVKGPSGQRHAIKCRTMVNINLPTQTITAAVISDNAHLRDLGCVEMRGAKPLLLLGQDNWELLVGRDFRRGRSGKPVASLTKLGWVIHGPFDRRCKTNDSCHCMAVSLPDLHDLVKAQFELEALGIPHNTRKHKDVERAMDVLNSTSRRTSDGRQWEVGLLWRHNTVQLPDNYGQARQRLLGIEKRMRKDATFADAYRAQIERLIKEGYARKLIGPILGSPVWYLPHFGVTNPNKPGKLRLVFDAAASFKGTCLNDNLLAGPDMLNSLLGILIKFRIGPVGFAGDIADMFLRIKIREEDQGAQLFLWRGDRDREPDVYVMTSMIFGAASSPTTAIYVLNKNAAEHAVNYPEAVEAVKSKHYMDDYLDSAWTVDKANRLIEEVTRVHATGGFNIRGWVTNSSELRDRLKIDMPDRIALEKGELATERTLGMIWAPGEDALSFDLSFKRLTSEVSQGQAVPTKRQFLSLIMSIFDPLGFLYPCIIQSRILMQRVWKSGIQWDEPLTDRDAKNWFEWLRKLETLKATRIPRWYGLKLEGLELHVFGDASELAYAAVAYLVGNDSSGRRQVAMVLGKARVAPNKVISIPRLELQAAVLACRIAETVSRELGPLISRRYYWTDSKTVLKWIQSEAYEFQRFVSHRLAEIDRLSERGSWRWVPSEDNPADKATRLCWPDTHTEWLSGPSFLSDPQERWPVCREVEAAEADLERIQRVHATATPDTPLLDYERYSSWTRVLRVMARVLAFIDRCRRRRDTAELLATDMQQAHDRLVKLSQEESFAVEKAAIEEGMPVPTKSKIKALDPMITNDGLLRVRGRLSACEVLTFGEKHPIILDGRHPLTRRLIAHYHAEALHANHETVLNNIREKYWVTRLRTAVKAAVRNCQLCRICHAKPAPPKMGDLPHARLEGARRAFVRVGVDYFGPMEVTIGRRREKRWGALFTCLATRAVHLELAASLSADSAILALRRLIARRGQPAHMYSDQGTNFVGANTELRAALRELDHGRVREEAINKGIQWHFNPPAAPHMGGCWERLVRSVKNALRSTLKERAPREEVLHTLLTEAELIINSRPLTYVHDDHNEPVVLTPNHLLLGTASGSTPYAAEENDDIDSRRQWRRVNALANMFWQRWVREYLPTLQRRGKWTNNVPSVSVGDVVVLMDPNRDRSVWTKGIIKAVYHGDDGIVRVVDVRTTHGVLRRPVAKIVVLPTKDML